MRADTTTKLPSRRRVLCLGCLRELSRTPDMDPAVPLQYCERSPCQVLAGKHDEYIEERQGRSAA